MGMRLGMALIAGTLAVGLAGGAFAQDDSTTTTYDKSGLKIATGKSFSFGMSTNMQLRAQLTDSRNVGSGADAGDSMSFYVRRLKSTFSGHVWDSKWNYRMVYAWQSATLEEAAVTYKHSDEMAFGMGRRKSFYNLQEYTSSSAQQFVDRSAANAEFHQGFVTGAWVDGSMKLDAHALRYHFGVFNGPRDTASNGAGAAAANQGFKLMYNARVELIGNGDSTSSVLGGESDLRADDKRGDLLFVSGIGANWNQLNDNETQQVGGTRTHKADVWSLVWDARVHVNGLSLNAGLFHRTVNYNDTADADAGHASGYTDIGAYAQLGYTINMESGCQLEPAIRYSLTDRDDFNSGGTQSDDSELAVGVNYFMHGHKAKVTFDATYAEARVHGVNADPTRPTVTYRLQLQLGF